MNNDFRHNSSSKPNWALTFPSNAQLLFVSDIHLTLKTILDDEDHTSDDGMVIESAPKNNVFISVFILLISVFKKIESIQHFFPIDMRKSYKIQNQFATP